MGHEGEGRQNSSVVQRRHHCYSTKKEKKQSNVTSSTVQNTAAEATLCFHVLSVKQKKETIPVVVHHRAGVFI
jgi:hypothetical protein